MGSLPSFVFGIYVVWFGSFGALGLWLAATGMRLRRNRAELRRVGLTATGVVVENRQSWHTSSDDSILRRETWSTYRPEVLYRAHDGRFIEVFAPMSTTRPLPIGTKVPLRYHPQHLNRVEIISGPGSGSPRGTMEIAAGWCFILFSMIMIIGGVATALRG